MKKIATAIPIAGLFLLGLATGSGVRVPGVSQVLASVHAPDTVSVTAANEMVGQYCVRCHNERRFRGNLSLDGFDIGAFPARSDVGEKMIRKLRTGMMPPAGPRRPAEAVLESLAVTLEAHLDAVAARDPNPGHRTFQRLNRAEYAEAIEALLGIRIDASAYLPGETVSAGFDNIADVQNLSATLLEAYLNGAAEIVRLAMGDPDAVPQEATYKVPRYASQREHVEGAPFGTRGGLSVEHHFVADGEYEFRMAFQHESTGNFFGQTAPFDEQIEISVDGERRALLDLDRWMHVQDPDGVTVRTQRIFVPTGVHRISAAFIKTFEGPVVDLMSPHDWTLADKKIGYSYGITALPHLRDLVIGGPYGETSVSETAARARILSCRPETDAEAAPCAESILERLGSQAFRRPLAESDIEALMGLYAVGAAGGSFEDGVRTALQGILASPDFVFRIEKPDEDVRVGETHRISDLDLASRLSFFLWAAPPDGALIELATAGVLSDPEVLEAQMARMLADPRSEALGTRFASQWLRLQDLEKVHPDALRFPDFYQQLADAMRRETELFFNSLVRDDASVLKLLTADYTYVDEQLARHYGMPGVTGTHFRRVSYPDATRRGVLGHGSILTLTSHANRTSPVLRGKWVMEVLLGSPPPPPPPDVPDLEETGEAQDGRMLTVRQRMEQHRANPSCNSCHRVIDPIGLALENFDVTGRYRIKDNGAAIDAVGELYDGTPITSPADLRNALLRRPEAFLRTFTENLMAYGLGRRIEYYDMPTVRKITREAASNDYRLSTFIEGVVNSDAFQMSRVNQEIVEDPAAPSSSHN